MDEEDEDEDGDKEERGGDGGDLEQILQGMKAFMGGLGGLEGAEFQGPGSKKKKPAGASVGLDVERLMEVLRGQERGSTEGDSSEEDEEDDEDEEDLFPDEREEREQGARQGLGSRSASERAAAAGGQDMHFFGGGRSAAEGVQPQPGKVGSAGAPVNDVYMREATGLDSDDEEEEEEAGAGMEEEVSYEQYLVRPSPLTDSDTDTGP